MSEMFPLKCEELPIPPRKQTLLTEPSSSLRKTDFIELHNDHTFSVRYEEMDAHEERMEELRMNEESIYSCGCSYHLDEISGVECVPIDMMPVSEDEECDEFNEHQRTSEKYKETFVESKTKENVASFISVLSEQKKKSQNKAKTSSVRKTSLKKKVIIKRRFKMKTVPKNTKNSKKKNSLPKIKKQCTDNCKCQKCKIQLLEQHEPLKNELPELHSSKMEQKNIKATEKRIIKNEKSCHCKKTMCLKKYCDCFSSGKRCGNSCKCQNCENIDE